MKKKRIGTMLVLCCFVYGATMSFLINYNQSLKLLLVLGLCPFVLNKLASRHKYAFRSSVYSNLYVVLISLVIVTLFFVHFFKNGFAKNIADIQSVVIFLEFSILTIAFIATITVAFFKRNNQMKLLNKIQKIENEMVQTIGCTTDNETLLSNIFFEHIVTIVLLIGSNICGIIYFETDRDFISICFYCITTLAIITVTEAVMHIKQVGEILLNLFTKMFDCAENFSTSEDSKIRRYNIITVLNFIDELHDLKECFIKCFGVHLVLNETKDFILMTSGTFYLLTSTLYIGHKFSWMELLFCVIFILPFIIKNIYVVSVLDKFGHQVIIIIFVYLKKKVEFQCSLRVFLFSDDIFYRRIGPVVKAIN